MLFKTKPSKKSKIVPTLLAAGFLSMSLVGGGKAFAAENSGASLDVKMQVDPGPRTIEVFADQKELQISTKLEGIESNSSVNTPRIFVTDASGTGAGWHLTMHASKLVKDDGTSLDGAISTFGIMDVRPMNGKTTSPSPKIVVPEGNSSRIDQEPLTVLSAAKGQGMGAYTVDVSNLNVDLPVSSYNGSYKSTLTYDLVTGP